MHRCPRPRCGGKCTNREADKMFKDESDRVGNSVDDDGKPVKAVACPKCGLWMTKV